MWEDGGVLPLVAADVKSGSAPAIEHKLFREADATRLVTLLAYQLRHRGFGAFRQADHRPVRAKRFESAHHPVDEKVQQTLLRRKRFDLRVYVHALTTSPGEVNQVIAHVR